MKTVITYGVFDLFHEGHVRLLERAKALGERLIVGVTTDQYAQERGKLCLVQSLEERLRQVAACPFVDQVIVEDREGQKVEDIARYRVDVFAIGDDWLGKFDYLRPWCEVVYLPRTPGVSSTDLRVGKYPTLRLGMIGCGRIAERFLREAGYVRQVRIDALYHPSPDSSQSVAAFRGRHTDIPLARTPEKLFDLVDAVYIASPHGTHYAYAKAALLAGRHVLCEKPLALSGEEAEELFALARERNLVLMEALKTAYCPGFCQLVSLCRSGEIGEIRDVSAAFTRLTPKNTREWQDREAGGSFTELGSYVLLPVVKLLGTDLHGWRFESLTDERGVDGFTRFSVRAGERLGQGVTGLSVKSLGELVISGTKGYIVVPAPWWKTEYFEMRFEDPNLVKRFSFPFEGDGLRYEIADFLHRARGYTGREYKLTDRESIQMAAVMGDFLARRRGAL